MQGEHGTTGLHSPLVKLRGLWRLLRPRQWVKNSFVLAPLLFTGQFVETAPVLQALLATLLFCLTASAAYIINDLQDIEADRLHPLKSKQRPLAAGIVSPREAMVLLIGLYALLGLLGWWFMPAVLFVLVAYLLLNLSYSFYLKHQPVLDIFTIAFGFVLRVYGGAVALNVELSGWMFISTFALALYLAAIKRQQELVQRGTQARGVLKKYTPALIARYAEMAATGALLFYSLFVMSVRPEMLMTIPVVLFGLFRYWYVVEQEGAGESPTDVLFTDRLLQLTVVIWIALCAYALWPA